MDIQKLFDNLNVEKKQQFLKNNNLILHSDKVFTVEDIKNMISGVEAYDCDSIYIIEFCEKCTTFKVSGNDDLECTCGICETSICGCEEYSILNPDFSSHICDKCACCKDCNSTIGDFYELEPITGIDDAWSAVVCEKCVFETSEGNIKRIRLEKMKLNRYLHTLKDIVLFNLNIQKISHKSVKEKYPLLFDTEYQDDY